MRSHSYLNTAKDILNVYDGNIPLTAWLKNFFKANKKYGNTDRKHISQLCFSFYRLGNSFQDISLEERLLTALFLCSTDQQFILQELKPEWSEKVSWPLEKKLADLAATSEIENIFPFNKHITPHINQLNYNRSFLILPSFFLRIRPGKNTTVDEKLQYSGFTYSKAEPDAVELPVGTKAEKILIPDSDIVVQDLNSQKVLELLQEKVESNDSFTAWDCCAASGGKSILLHDLFLNARITVSDVRESILINLSKRFARAGISHYKKFVADISQQPPASSELYDIIICDAPCSGSGTWSRTPEQLRFFREEKISYYVSLQKKIVFNAAQRLKKKGFFLYITCSVFAEENEQIVSFITNELGFQLNGFRYYSGYDQKADTLFAALFSAG
jgi:16S rRNA (cytosine967-C5)-methyltransferase